MPNAYQQSILSLRYAPLKRTAETEERVLTALQTAADQLKRLIGNTDSPLTKKFYNRRRLQVAALMNQLAIGLKKDISDQVQAIADEVAAIMQEETNDLLQENLRADVVADFTQVPREVLNWSADRQDREGLKLSASIWADNQTNQIESVLLAGMARGESARDLSLKLEQFILGGGQGLGDSVRSKAMRLARTEINNSYWEARRMSSELSPVVEGIKWELSAQHPEWDVCDYLSKQDLYGLGPGVYPPELLPPKPHPNCLCYSVDVLRDVEAWDQPRDVPGLQEQPSDVPLGRRANGFTENYIKRQHDLFVQSVEATEAAYRLSPRPEPIPTIPAPVLPPPEVETAPDFVPAKTFEEAVRFAEDHLANTVVFENAKGKKELTLKNLNTINEGLSKVIKGRGFKVDYLGTLEAVKVAEDRAAIPKFARRRKNPGMAFYQVEGGGRYNFDALILKKPSITNPNGKGEHHRFFLENRDDRLARHKRGLKKVVATGSEGRRRYLEDTIAELEATQRFASISDQEDHAASLMNMAIHEGAHAMYYRGSIEGRPEDRDPSLLSGAPVAQEFIGRLQDNGVSKIDKLRVSEYAASNDAELFAEVTVFDKTGRRDEVPENVLRAYDETVSKWKAGPLTRLQKEGGD